MDGYRGVLEFQPYATSLPNGTANTRGLASPHKVSGFKAGRAGTRIFAVGDHTRVWARIACQTPKYRKWYVERAAPTWPFLGESL